MDKRSPFYSKNRIRKDVLENSDLYVKCKICGKLTRRRLSTHIRKRHGLSWGEYIKKFPGEKNECQEIRSFAYEYMKVEGRIIKRNNVIKNWELIKRRKSKECNHTCQICGFNRYVESLTGHHIKPVQYGGENKYENCIIVCENCHRHLHKIFNDLLKRKIAIEDIVRTYVKT